MPLRTTTIGAYPKPKGSPVPNWPDLGEMRRAAPTRAYDAYLAAALSPSAMRALDRMTAQVVREQVDLGIDVPTDGEIRREHYVYYHCRHVSGVSFTQLTTKTMRGGGWRAEVPTVIAPLEARAPFLVRDWQMAQAATRNDVKITIPGALTVADTIADNHYGDTAQFCRAWADCINVEIRRLAAAGCRWIQIDEPVFARQVGAALEFGIDCLNRAFVGLGPEVNKVVHICCGYPAGLDAEGGDKADRRSYFELAPALDQSAVNAVSIEDAHRHTDLQLLERYQNTRVILGSIEIARSAVEPVELIATRLSQALDHIDAHRLLVAPDCGLVMLPHEIAKQKLSNMVTAANSF